MDSSIPNRSTFKSPWYPIIRAAPNIPVIRVVNWVKKKAKPLICRPCGHDLRTVGWSNPDYGWILLLQWLKFNPLKDHHVNPHQKSHD